ncbi:hypothetical protein KM043_003404 [Ampulex compressa]|nr:hypothetical protein KM043_003404 [Ampulex compressa]
MLDDERQAEEELLQTASITVTMAIYLDVHVQIVVRQAPGIFKCNPLDRCYRQDSNKIHDSQWRSSYPPPVSSMLKKSIVPARLLQFPQNPIRGCEASMEKSLERAPPDKRRLFWLHSENSAERSGALMDED